MLVTDIEPAAKVKAAMNEINAAQRLRLAAYEQSEADKVGARARGQGRLCRMGGSFRRRSRGWGGAEVTTV